MYKTALKYMFFIFRIAKQDIGDLTLILAILWFSPQLLLLFHFVDE